MVEYWRLPNTSDPSQSLIIADVYFDDIQYMDIQQVNALTVEGFISQIGGTMGLWTGTNDLCVSRTSIIGTSIIGGVLKQKTFYTVWGAWLAGSFGHLLCQLWRYEGCSTFLYPCRHLPVYTASWCMTPWCSQ